MQFRLSDRVPIDKLGREDVLKILTPLWTKRPETARRLRQKMRTTFKWAQANGFIETNPAGEMIDGGLAEIRGLVKEHYRSLPYRDVAGALEKDRTVRYDNRKTGLPFSGAYSGP